MKPIYEIAIIGGGVIGCAAAWELCRYRGNHILLEGASELCAGATKANSGIIHGGFHYSAQNTLKGRLELAGNRKMHRWQQELQFPYSECGILMVAFSDEEMNALQKLYQQGIANGVEDLEWCSRERILELEPVLPSAAAGGFRVPHAGVIEPYCYGFALADGAAENGTEIRRDFPVVRGNWLAKEQCWEIVSASGERICARYVINAAGGNADRISAAFGGEDFEISARKGEEYLLRKNGAGRPNHILFPVPTPTSKGVLVIPTQGGTTMIGPTADLTDDRTDTATSSEKKEAIFQMAKRMSPALSPGDLIAAFSGLRAVCGNDFKINADQKKPHLIHAAGIQSPGLTAAPAIAELLTELLEQAGWEKIADPAFHLPPPPQKPLREMTPEEMDRAAQQDPLRTKVICRCETVSEAEIVDAIRRGHTTVQGIKLATRAGMGNCQGGFCQAKIVEIIARETGMAMEKGMWRGKGSAMFRGTLQDVTASQLRESMKSCGK